MVLKRSMRLKLWFALVLTGLVALTCSATSVVVLVTRFGITVGADTKGVLFRSQSPPMGSKRTTKLFVLRNRIAVAHIGFQKFSNASIVKFDSILFIEEVRQNMLPRATVSELAEIVKEQLAEKFDGFDVMLTTGTLKPEDLPPPGDTLMKYIVAGYESGDPRVFFVELTIDWDALHLNAPSVIPWYPFRDKKNISLTFAGNREKGIIELQDPKSDTFKKAAADFPLELKALIDDRDLTLPQTVSLARALLGIEIYHNPETVGYPIKIVTIPKQGMVVTSTYDH